ncbi:hypothetical protein JX265_013390 [Neoarthrinium moseri]|uniref:NmrA-like domain-containing protein n=1 Tax=Neoarthrinium moseri TaxID=1658444 RepID=A0A9P9W8F6_9PEZI|nr:hypothetical protein JX265_013390 [Neoarthrinium moseri]
MGDQDALIAAMENIDVVISLVGHEGIQPQYNLIDAITHTNVKLFIPSDLAYRSEEPDLRVRVREAKDKIEQAARDAGIPTTVILPGNLVESSVTVGRESPMMQFSEAFGIDPWLVSGCLAAISLETDQNSQESPRENE